MEHEIRFLRWQLWYFGQRKTEMDIPITVEKMEKEITDLHSRTQRQQAIDNYIREYELIHGCSSKICDGSDSVEASLDTSDSK